MFVKPLRHFVNGAIPADTWTYLFDDLFRLDTKAYEPYGEGVQVAGVLVQRGTDYFLYRDFPAVTNPELSRAILIRIVANPPELEGPPLRSVFIGKIVEVIGYLHRSGDSAPILDAHSIRWTLLSNPDPKLLHGDPVIR